MKLNITKVRFMYSLRTVLRFFSDFMYAENLQK